VVEGAPRTVLLYQTSKGKRPFDQWLDSLKDQRDVTRIQARLLRVEFGNLGDAKSVGDGVTELRFFFGSGYRVYIGQHGNEIVVLLCGGDKTTQGKDIEEAKAFWADFQRRQDEKT